MACDGSWGAPASLQGSKARGYILRGYIARRGGAAAVGGLCPPAPTKSHPRHLMQLAAKTARRWRPSCRGLLRSRCAARDGGAGVNPVDAAAGGRSSMTQAQRNPERPQTALLVVLPTLTSTQLERCLQGSPGMATTTSGTLWRRSSGDETGLGDECS